MCVDWGQVYEATFLDLVRFLTRKVWDPERARDLAQEAFVRALETEPDRPRAWLFTVATNLARDEARLATRRKRHLTLLKGETDRARPPEAEENVARRQRLQRLREALDGLAGRDREILLLWSGGLSYREIAAETGLSPGAIGTTLARARKRLVEAHERLEADEDAAS